MSRVLSLEQYQAAATALGCEPAVLRAIAAVEGSSRGAFDEAGFPTLLFEPHLFHRFTDGRYDESHPGLSYATPTPPGGYGKFSEQRPRMEAAAKLDEEAAWRATSWGLFQCLGDNWELVGARSLLEFVAGMCSGVEYHLKCLVGYLAGRAGAAEAARTKDWTRLGELYNGKGQARFGWADKARAAYQRLA